MLALVFGGTMWWLLIGCVSVKQVAEMEAALHEAQLEIAALTERVDALEGRLDADRSERLAELADRVARTRRERELAGLANTDDPGELAEAPALTIRQAFSDLTYAEGLARPLVYRTDAGPSGYRLSAIASGSLLDRVGFRNGDVVHAVNGMELTSKEASMQAYEQLNRPEVEELVVTITRRGERIELRIDPDEPKVVKPAAPIGAKD